MDKKIKKLWLEALRSGKYKQGRGQLKTDDNKFCCLGVLCDLHSKEFNREWKENDDYLGCDLNLPIEVQKWAGLEENAPIVKDSQNIDQHLDGFNDGIGSVKSRSFKQIANYIEKSL